MSLAALCIFIWAVLSGMFRNVEDIAVRAYRAEVGDDEQQLTSSTAGRAGD